MTRRADVVRFYELVDEQAVRCGGAALLSDINARTLPKRGVYFFFEAGEARRESGTGLRVVRVGTHALGEGSRSTLSQRLRQHRGGQSGSGNHRGSIFRLLVGAALMSGEMEPHCRSWGIKGEARKAAALLGASHEEIKAIERPIELAVSRYIGAMPVVWIDIGDEPGPSSARGRIERNAIALLSNMDRAPIDPPALTWLGHYSARPLVRASGLWNQNHVTEAHDPSFLEDVERFVRGGRRA